MSDIDQALKLRRKIGRAWRTSNRPARSRMFRQALRFALTTMGYSTQAAETVFIQGRGPLFKMAKKKYRGILQDLEALEAFNYRTVFRLMRSHGMEAKASFVLALLGYNGKDGVCPDQHWVKILGYPDRYLTRTGKYLRARTEELRLVIYNNYEGVEGSWVRWFEDNSIYGNFHIPVLRRILNESEDGEDS
jgi:hypothetical protein